MADRVSRRSKRKTVQFRGMFVFVSIIVFYFYNIFLPICIIYQTVTNALKDQLDRSKALCSFNILKREANKMKDIITLTFKMFIAVELSTATRVTFFRGTVGDHYFYEGHFWPSSFFPFKRAHFSLPLYY